MRSGDAVAELPRAAALDQVIEGIADVERRVARLRAEQAALVDELDRLIGVGLPDAAREELMATCRLTATQAQRRLQTSTALMHRLAHTRNALAAGRISFEHAAALADATAGLGRHQAALVETEVLDDPRAHTPGQLAWRAREAAARLLPLVDPAPRREPPARSLVGYWHDDGAVDYYLSLAPADAALVSTFVDAASGRQGPGDLRRATERRADAIVDLVRQALDTGALPAAGDGRRPHVELLADLDRLRADATGTVLVNGHPVPGPLMRGLACDPDVRLSVLDRERLADQGRTHRLVTSVLRSRLAVRDQHCRFPGCSVQPRSCRAHHIVHWADGGRTDLRNLLLVCARHHHAVHDGGWSVDLHADGTVRWTSPAGQRVVHESDLASLAEPEDLTDAELGLDGPETSSEAWVRPWWEFLFLDRRPPPPPPGEKRAAERPPVEVCPF
ncbi:MAG TPA: DUF222 domain-containing protein [Mycobacteriales bacterium]